MSITTWKSKAGSASLSSLQLQTCFLFLTLLVKLMVSILDMKDDLLQNPMAMENAPSAELLHVVEGNLEVPYIAINMSLPLCKFLNDAACGDFSLLKIQDNKLVVVHALCRR